MGLRNKGETILHCIDSLALGGAEILLKETLPLLTNYKNIVCYLHPPDILISELNDYPVCCLDHHSNFSFFQTVKRLRRIIEEYEVSIVHAHLFQSTLISRFASSKEMKFVFTVHNLLSKDAFEVNRISLWAERLSYKKRQTIIGVSREVLRDYDDWVGIKGKSFVLYNYVNDKFFNVPYDPAPDISSGFKLIAVGNLRRQKNYTTLLDALSLLRDLPISLDIYGGGDMEHELADKITKGQLNVKLMGRVTDVSKVLPAYHAYIMPSLFEGFGIAPMEAMAAGMPVILSGLSVFREVAEKIPVYFDPHDARCIAEAIRYVFENWRDVNIKGPSGRALIKQKASREVYLSKLMEIYAS